MDEPLSARLLEHAREARETLVVTGAGVSLASGIPTFRGSDPGAVWARDVTELGTRAYFERDPVGSWEYYLRRFEKLRHATPNPAHRALVAWERWHREVHGSGFLLVTQNVDCLHEQAGSSSLVKVHGSADRLRCSKEGCEHGAPRGTLPRELFDVAPFLAAPAIERIPRCPSCGSLLRQHVLWFDEYYDAHHSYEIGRVLQAAKRADLVLFVGTSFSVGITDLVLKLALSRRAAIFSIDPGVVAPHRNVLVLPEPAELALPRLVAGLSAGRGTSG